MSRDSDAIGSGIWRRGELKPSYLPRENVIGVLLVNGKTETNAEIGTHTIDQCSSKVSRS
jgi:hypothetical protein